MDDSLAYVQILLSFHKSVLILSHSVVRRVVSTEISGVQYSSKVVISFFSLKLLIAPGWFRFPIHHITRSKRKSEISLN
jgi:hypothetical protein